MLYHAFWWRYSTKTIYPLSTDTISNEMLAKERKQAIETYHIVTQLASQSASRLKTGHKDFIARCVHTPKSANIIKTKSQRTNLKGTKYIEHMFQLDYLHSCGYFRSIPYNSFHVHLHTNKSRSPNVNLWLSNNHKNKTLIRYTHVAPNRFQMARIESFHLRDQESKKKSNSHTHNTDDKVFDTKNSLHSVEYSIEWFLLSVRIEMPW